MLDNRPANAAPRVRGNPKLLRIAVCRGPIVTIVPVGSTPVPKMAEWNGRVRQDSPKLLAQPRWFGL
jgi:hypothetical protein